MPIEVWLTIAGAAATVLATFGGIGWKRWLDRRDKRLEVHEQELRPLMVEFRGQLGTVQKSMLGNAGWTIQHELRTIQFGWKIQADAYPEVLVFQHLAMLHRGPMKPWHFVDAPLRFQNLVERLARDLHQFISDTEYALDVNFRHDATTTANHLLSHRTTWFGDLQRPMFTTKFEGEVSQVFAPDTSLVGKFTATQARAVQHRLNNLLAPHLAEFRQKDSKGISLRDLCVGSLEQLSELSGVIDSWLTFGIQKDCCEKCRAWQYPLRSRFSADFEPWTLTRQPREGAAASTLSPIRH